MTEIANAADHADYGLVLGLGNSHDRMFPVSISLKSGLFGCDNLALSGQVTIVPPTVHSPQVVNCAVK